MIYTWEIFVDNKSKGFVRSMTEYGACEAYYMKHGSASRYSGIGMNQIEARKV